MKTYCIVDIQNYDLKGCDFNEEEVIAEARDLCAFLYNETKYAPETFNEAIQFFEENSIFVFEMNSRIKSGT